MNLSFLVDVLNSNKEFKFLLNMMLEKTYESSSISVRESVKPLIISSLYNKLQLPILVLSSEAEKAFKLFYRLQNWMENTVSLVYFPEQYSIDSAKSDLENAATRLRTISRLSQFDAQPQGSPKYPFVITSLLAATERIISPSKFKDSNLLIEVGMTLEKEKFLSELINHGYDSESRVEVPGTFSYRGGIIDIYPMTNSSPVRLELNGNKVDSLRLFDSKTQRSLEIIEKLEFNKFTAVDNLQSDSTMLDFLYRNTLLILDDYEKIMVTTNQTNPLNSDYMLDHSANSICWEESIHQISYSDLQEKIDRFTKRLSINSWNTGDAKTAPDIIFHFSPIPQYGGRLEIFLNDLKRNLDAGYRVVIVSQQKERILELLTEKDFHVYQITGIEPLPGKGTVSILKGFLEEGWILENTLALFTDYEIFGWVKQERLTPKRLVKHHLYLNQLREGSYVVHIDHGIGKFIGFSKIENDGTENEYLVLEYAAGDKLYIPVHQVERISLYVGGRDQTPSLSRLHTQEWDLTKIRIKKSVRDIARDLLQLYAVRETTIGFTYSPDTIWQRELESSFPYIETQDQLKAVSEVKDDMETKKPMDRLICGDVGYGKTEIALRAAFKAVMDNKQVTVLVPTTVLAQQHYQTFHDRLQAFPVRLEVLSRFSSDKEQSTIIQGLASGSVDICIGTHRLLQKDVIFKNLGLLIIDEEQRFGVAHKEFFKKLRQEIDILTLSATPIPRTLHMSLTGIKDLSTLETPPEDRLPIKTFVGPYNKQVVRDSILREMKRQGQVYYVHNRVHNIHVVASELKFLIPEAEILVAHGQMPEADIGKVMSDFIKHKADILLTTTIIESGIDIPNANTLIIDESDKLGLTQLYQLRGRIGRGANTAFAYFFYRANKHLTEQAKKRLITIAEATDLGAGYAIAMKDLEIRGAGNLLGTEQSGYIAAVGFDLYCRLLAEAVDELKKGKTYSIEKMPASNHTFETTISLPLNAYIPEAYMPDMSDRIWFYHSLAAAITDLGIKEIEEELHDRFGHLPAEVDNLIYIAKLRRYANGLGLERINAKNTEITLFFEKSIDISGLIPHKYLREYRDIFKIGLKQIKMDIVKAGEDWQQILLGLIKNMAVRLSKSV